MGHVRSASRISKGTQAPSSERTRCESPERAHPSREALRPAERRDKVGVPGVQAADEGTDRGAADHVDGDALLLQRAQGADMGDAAGAAAAEDDADRLSA
jgi:hypothetical protein